MSDSLGFVKSKMADFKVPSGSPSDTTEESIEILKDLRYYLTKRILSKTKEEICLE
jgi:hypothetical protein